MKNSIHRISDARYYSYQEKDEGIPARHLVSVPDDIRLYRKLAAITIIASTFLVLMGINYL